LKFYLWYGRLCCLTDYTWKSDGSHKIRLIFLTKAEIWNIWWGNVHSNVEEIIAIKTENEYDIDKTERK
jgi:hypothetical protein